MFAFIAVLVFKLLSLKVLFIKRKDNRNFLKYINRRLQLSPLNDCKIINCWNQKFLGYF